jgi:hypothetical protein
MTTRDVGKALCFATAIACALLHAATFMTIVPGLLILVPFLLMMGAVLLRTSDARMDSLCLPSQATIGTHRQNSYSRMAFAGLCDSPVCVLLPEFRRSIERWNRGWPIRLHVQGNRDPANIRKRIQNVPDASRENHECVAGHDGHILFLVIYRSGERPECTGRSEFDVLNGLPANLKQSQGALKVSISVTCRRKERRAANLLKHRFPGITRGHCPISRLISHVQRPRWRTAASRLSIFFGKLWIAEAVAHIAIREQICRMSRIILQFPAQLTDIRSQVLSFAAVFRTPDKRQQSPVRQWTPRMPHKRM